MRNCGNCLYARKLASTKRVGELVGCSYMAEHTWATLKDGYTGTTIYEGYIHPRRPYQEVSKDILFSSSILLSPLVEVGEICNKHVIDENVPMEGFKIGS